MNFIPDFDDMSHVVDRVVGVYTCANCDAPVMKDVSDCQFCGYSLNWGK